MSREPTHDQTRQIVQSAFEEVGCILAEARQEKNLSIAQVATAIHIRQQYLQDLEEGKLLDLPGIVYILGFIRTYARFLDLDGDELIRRLKRLPHLPNPDPQKTLAPMCHEDRPTPLILLLSGAFVLLMGGAGYFFLQSILETSVPLPIEEPVKENPQEPSPEDLSEVTVIEGSPLTSPEVVVPPTPDKPTLSKETTVPPVLPEAAPSLTKITLKATEPCWIEIRDGQGRIMVMKVLKPGDTYVVPQKPGVTINMGNAGGIDVFRGDTKLPSLGAHGEVRRGIRPESFQ